MQISYAKLQNGDWGVRVVLNGEDPFEEFPADDTTVTVVKKSGDTKDRIVTRQIWTGENEDGSKVALYALD